jgi:hypothetical protein
VRLDSRPLRCGISILPMTAVGRSFGDVGSISELPLKAEVDPRSCDVAKVPKAVIRLGLFDHLVGAQQKRLWDRQTKRLGRLEIHDQLKLGRQLYRQISGLRTLENQIDV